MQTLCTLPTAQTQMKLTVLETNFTISPSSWSVSVLRRFSGIFGSDRFVKVFARLKECRRSGGFGNGDRS